MKKIAAMLSIATLALLSACGDDLEGEVTDKTFKEGYSYTQMQQICNNINNVRTCNFYPTTHHVPDCYKLHVKTPEGKNESDCVSHERWDSVEVGDYYIGADVKEGS